MTRTFGPLFRTELRRLMTPAGIILPFLFTILTATFILAASRFDQSVRIPILFLQFVGGFIIVLGVPLTGVGMVATDVKEHWLRSLLMRPVSRSEYLLARVSAVYVMLLGTILLAGVLPSVAIPMILGKPIVWMASRSIPTFVFLLGHAYLILVLLTFLSCWLPGIVNIAMLGLWALGSSMISAYVKFELWDNGFAVVATEYLFPGGFLDAAERAARHEGDPLIPALWGLAASVVFTALAFWSVNRVQVDGGAE